MPTQGTVVASTLDASAYQDRISAVDFRFAMASLVMPRPGTTLSYRGGVFAAGDSGTNTHTAMMVEPGAGMSVTVRIGNCIIDTASNGPYDCALDSQKTLTLNGSSSTQNRYDLIVARVYDDQNPAIGSPAGVRKFVVEVWTGDGSTGTPTVPTPTPTAGWIPLASVYVGKTVSSITAANIADLRGPGLTARGGMRLLSGADALQTSGAYQEAGAYPGDQRFVLGDAFPHQVYGGNNGNPAQSGWRGVHNARFYEAVSPTGFYINPPAGTHVEMLGIDIPYPGTPFRIKPTARASLYMTANVSVDFRIHLTNTSGALVNWTNVSTYGRNPAEWGMPAVVSPWAYGIFTTGIRVIMSASLRDVPGGGYARWTGTDGDLNKLQVEVIPASFYYL